MASKNANGNGTIRKRKDGRWEGRVTTGVDMRTGKQIQRSVYGKTKKETAQKLREIIADVDSGLLVESGSMTVGEWVEIWINQYANNIKELSMSTYRAHIRNHIAPKLGDIKLSNLKTRDIQMMYNALLRREKPLTAKTIKNIHGVLHKALSQAVKLGYIRYNPADNVSLPKVEKPELKPITDEHIAEFLEAIKGHCYELLYTIDLFTGMRKGEILGLTWDCVNLDTGVVVINKQLIQEKKKGGQYKLASTKNSKGRTVRIPPSVIELFRQQKAKQTSWKKEAGSAWDNSLNLVFTNEIGGHLSHTTVTHSFKKIVQSIGLESTRFHDLRHSYAVAAIESGIDMKTVQENLGHHAASFTMDVYGHVSDRMRLEGANRMEQFIQNISNSSIA